MVELDYTGHPLFDVGLAAIVALAEKSSPAELTIEDLEKAADFIRDNYTKQPLTSFLTTSLPNSDFTQPAFKDNPTRRREYAERVGRSFGDDIARSDEVCVFTGKSAMGRALSLKRDEKSGKELLLPGRAFRQHIPLITGEDIINFSPWGDPGLPVSGEALLCLQFFPMGCRKCAGRLLAIHSDNYDVLQKTASQAFHENNSAIVLVQATHETKLPDASPSAPTLIIETIIDLTRQQNTLQQRRPDQKYSITAYHLTNSGQSSPLDEKSPMLKIYHLPYSTVSFLQRASWNPKYRETWNTLVRRGQQVVKVKPAKNKQDKTQKSVEDEQQYRKGARNYFYEDVLRLPDDMERFLRRYCLAIRDLQATLKTTQSSHPVIPWTFIDLFLQEVMHMNKKRIEAIKELGDRLAVYVKDSDDKRFFNNFYTLKRRDYFLNEILRADRNAVVYRKTILFPFDLFRDVFFEEESEESLYLDWSLARDLTFIRMLEWLHEHDEKFAEHVNALEEKELELTTSNSEEQQ